VDYVAVYDDLIARARGRVRHGYMERHHVTPKCMGGNNHEENLVYLTAKEHFIAHKTLVRMYPDVYGLWQALIAMGRIVEFKSRIFASERQRAAELRRGFRYSEASKKRMSASASARGKNSPETEFKPGQKPWNAGLPPEQSHRYGKKHSPVTIARMVEVQQARKAEHSARMKLWWRERKATLTQGDSA
jgi:NUMOD3 motif./HNH endonuclease.